MILFANFLSLWSLTGLQKVPPLVRPGAGGALHRGDGNKRWHHAAREVSGQSAAGHSRGSGTWLRQSGENTFPEPAIRAYFLSKMSGCYEVLKFGSEDSGVTFYLNVFFLEGERAASQCEGGRESTPTRVRGN